MKKSLILLSLFVFIFAVSCAKKDKEEAKKGKTPAAAKTSKDGAKSAKFKVPAFKIPGLWGGTVSNDDYKGKVSIVEVWGYRCPHCRHQAKYLEELAKTLDFSKYAIISIHSYEGEAAKSKVAQHFKNKKIKVALGSGEIVKSLRSLPKKYQVRGIPHLMIVNSKGEIEEVLRGARKPEALMNILKKYK